jgi:tetratricopeptide (TPR) repeat protein
MDGMDGPTRPRRDGAAADREGHLARSLVDRFEESDDRADIDEAIAHAREAMRLSTTNTQFANQARNYANCLLTRFERFGPHSDLKKAVEWHRKAVTKADAGERWKYLASLGNALTEQFRATDWIPVLGEAVAVLRESARLAAESDAPGAHIGIGNLAHALCLRYDRVGDAADLDEAITMARQAAEKAATSPRIRANWWEVLGSAHRMRYTSSTDPKDLTDASAALADALADTPEHDPARPRRLRELGVILGELFALVGTREALDEAITAQQESVALTPDGHPETGAWLGSLANSHYWRSRHFGTADDLDEAVLLSAASTAEIPKNHPEWPTWRGAHAEILLGRFHSRGNLADLDAAVAAFSEVARLTPANHNRRAHWLLRLADVLLARYLRRGSGTDLAAALRIVSGLDMDRLTSDQLDTLASTLQESYRHSGDRQFLDNAIVVAAKAVAKAPPDRVLSQEVVHNLAVHLLTRFELTGQGGDVDTAEKLLSSAAASLPEGHRWQALVLINLGWAKVLRYQHGIDDDSLVDEALGCFDEALTAVGTDLDASAFAAELSARAVRLRFERRGTPSDRAQVMSAEKRLRAVAEQLADHYGHRHRADVLREQARLLRALGQRERGRAMAREALRGQMWSLLVQDTTADMLHVARQVADSAMFIAWCLDDGAPGEAVAVVESLRALVVHSVTARTTIAELLTTAGLVGLRDEWRTAVHPRPDEPAEVTLPNELRHRVLDALAQTAANNDRQTGRQARTLADLVDAPAPGELAASCRELGVDALVYLVQGSSGQSGAALVLHADGEVTALRNKKLVTTKRGAMARFAAAHDLVLEDPDDLDHRRQWRRALDDVLSWAWMAGMRQVVAEVGTRVRHGGTPRLFVVPTGALGLVPWHAARRRIDSPDGPRYRYAVEDAVVSYAPSGRVAQWFARTASRPLDGRGLVVVDPTHDLKYARLEGEAILRDHYPRAVRLGGPAEPGVPPATARSVLDMVTSGRDGTGPPLLHFACHAVSTAPSVDSFLLLADNDRLTVRDLLDHGRVSHSSGPLVVLSVCSSAVPADRYDEALSLATAFSAVGAGAVIGSLWAVSDSVTSTVMRDFHAMVSNEALPSADALREAQLCALRAAQRRQQRRPSADDAVWSWAAFVHYGRGHH